MSMFTQEEAQALQTFLSRVNLNGGEAKTMVYLQNKIEQMTDTSKEDAKKKK